MVDSLRIPVEIIAQDLSGLDAVGDLNEGISQTSKEIEQLGKEVEGDNQLTQLLEDYQLRFGKLQAQLKTVDVNIAETLAALGDAQPNTAGYDRLQARLETLQQTQKQYQKQLQSIPDDFRAAAVAATDYETRISGVRNEVGKFGDTEAAFRTVTGAIGFAGGAQVEQAANAVAEILALSEALPLLREGFSGIVQNAAKAGKGLTENAGLLGTLATAAAAMAGGTTTLAGSLAALLPVLLPVAAAVAAAGLALKAFNDFNERAAEATRTLIKEQEQLFTLRRGGTQDEIEARKREIETNKEITDAIIAQNKATFDQFEQEATGLGRAVADIFNIGGSRELRENLQELESESRQAGIALGLYNQILDDQQVIANQRVNQLALEGQAYADLKQAIDNADVSGFAKDYKDALQQQANIQTQITFLENQKIEASDEVITALDRQIEALRLEQLDPTTDKIDALESAMQRLGVSAADLTVEITDGAQGFVNYLEAQRQNYIDITNLIETGSSEQVQQRRRQIDLEIEAIQRILPSLENAAETSDVAADALTEYNNRLDELQGEQGRLNDDLVETIRAREMESEILRDQLDLFQQRIDSEVEIADLIRNASSEQIAERIQGLEDEKNAIANILPELRKLATDSDEAAAQLSQYQTRLRDINDEIFMLQGTVTEGVTAREQQEKLAEIEQLQQEHLANIVDIRADGQAKELDLIAKFQEKELDLETKHDNDVANIQKRMNDEISKTEKEYMRDRIQAWEQFRKDEKRRLEDANDERLSILDDLHASLVQAEEDNNVVAFIRAERDAQRRLDEQAAQVDKETRRRQEDFLAQRELEQQQLEMKLDDIRERARQERAAADKQFQEKLGELDTQYAVELGKIREQTNARIKAEQDAIDKLLSQSGIQINQFTQQVTAGLVDSIEETTQAQIQAQDDVAQKKIDLEANAISTTADNINFAFTGILTNIQNMTLGFVNSLQQATSQSSRSTTSTARSSASTSRLFRTATAFADEGIVSSPTLAFIGEDLEPNEIEAVIRLKPSDGLPSGFKQGLMNGGGGDTYNFDFNVSGGVSEEFVRAQVAQGFKQFVNAVRRARSA